MSKLDSLQQDGLRSELILQQQLKALSETLQQQLQETEGRLSEELDRRIHLNAKLSTDQDCCDENIGNHQARHVGMRRSTSTSALTSDKKTFQHPRHTQTLNAASSDWLSQIKQTHCSVRSSTWTPKTTQMRKEEEDKAECQKKFSALPVPSHIIQPLYQQMMELRETRRKQGHEQRREFLCSIQKPFSFHLQERQKEKKEETAVLNQVPQGQKAKAAAVRKAPPRKERKDPTDGPRERELPTHAPINTAVRRENPAESGSPKRRTAERTRRERLGFLDVRPSFQPKIIQQVPDFRKIHKTLQTVELRKPFNRDSVIKCQPFSLRTSALPARQSRKNPETSQAPKKSDLSRSKSLGAITSLSLDTLPVYITDAVRKRRMAIRKSMELRDSKDQETADWLRRYQTRSQAMSKRVTLHAKLLDPHSSLKDVYSEKLQLHRTADQQRMREYKRELRDMKARVSERPFLFEQVKQRNAKAHAEQTYRDKLKKAGLKEQFVQENGEAAEGTPTTSRSGDDTDDDDILSREENVADGEKIEDVEEKSVKSKGEERP